MVLVIIAMGVWIWYLYKSKKEGEGEVLALQKEKDEAEASFAKAAASQAGLSEYNKKLQEKKDRAKQKVMDLLAQKSKISNREAAQALGVSRITIIRYFDELENEGKAKQVGKTGQNVFYEAK